MPDFVVDLDLCIDAPGAWDFQFSVAVTASDRDAAAQVAMLIASDLDYEANDRTMRKPYEVAWRAVENDDAIDDGTYDHDWRHITIGSKLGHRPH
jgi:hypothetical protein